MSKSKKNRSKQCLILFFHSLEVSLERWSTGSLAIAEESLELHVYSVLLARSTHHWIEAKPQDPRGK